jgi:hypothetical protein
LGTYAFMACTKLTSIYANSSLPIDLSLNNDVFREVNTSTCILYVPIGSRSAYKVAKQWSSFTKIIEKATGINQINNEKIILFPNPATESFSIEGVERNSALTLTDINGKLLLEQKIQGVTVVSVDKLPKGVYFVKLINSKGIIERKILKN